MEVIIMYKKRIIELQDEIKMLQKRLKLYEECKKTSDEASKSSMKLLSEYIEENKKLKEEIPRLTKLNDMLTSAVCGCCKVGTFIVYDEHNPRNICVIKDGTYVDTDNATSVSFNWYKNEFPSFEVTTE